MAESNRALKEPKPPKSGWFERIEKAKRAHEQGRQAQAAQGDRRSAPKWHE